ncbi:MAG TPA: hypothetical protein VFF65_13605 [Phycisphaerales bacterium]|nr:hypothetical protein [Phycisphaerales bacterium]
MHRLLRALLVPLLLAVGGCAGGARPGSEPAARPADVAGLWRVTDDCVKAYRELATTYAAGARTEVQLDDAIDMVRSQNLRLHPAGRFVYQPNGAAEVRGTWTADTHAVDAALEPDALNIITRGTGGTMRFDRIGPRLALNVAAPAGPAPSFDFTFERVAADPDAHALLPVPVTDLTAATLAGVWVPDEPAMRAAPGTAASRSDPRSRQVLQMQLHMFKVAFNPDGTYVMAGHRGRWQLDGQRVRMDPPASMEFELRDGRLRGGEVVLVKVEAR